MLFKAYHSIVRHANVIEQLIIQQFILRYRRTFLGYLWTLLNPLISMSIPVLVFSSLFKSPINEYGVFFFSGMVVWNFFSTTIIRLGTVFIDNSSLIRTVYIPKVFFPFSCAVTTLVDSFFLFCIVLVMIKLLGGHISAEILFIPVAYLLLFIFTFGISLINSVATVYYRDLSYIVQIILQAWLFLTPIMYEKKLLSGLAAQIISLNPIVPFLDIFRAPFYPEIQLSMGLIMPAVILSFASLVLGGAFFLINQEKIVFRL